jgi:hypothetical protein
MTVLRIKSSLQIFKLMFINNENQGQRANLKPQSLGNAQEM